MGMVEVRSIHLRTSTEDVLQEIRHTSRIPVHRKNEETLEGISRVSSNFGDFYLTYFFLNSKQKSRNGIPIFGNIATQYGFFPVVI